MKKNGFSIIELLVVIVIMGILMGIAGIAYSTWMNKYRLETQTREMYVDLMNARVQAMQKNMAYLVVVAANGYSYRVVEDTDEDGAPDPDPGDTTRSTKQLRYPLDGGAITVTMNTRGLVASNPTLNATLRFTAIGVDAAFDCITLFTTRIRMGKLNGQVCNPR